MIFTIALHTLSAIIWVGGMFFAYMVLRPASEVLAPEQRLRLWAQVFARFFRWVWLAIILLLGTGYWMIFFHYDGFGQAGLHIHIMHSLGILMIALFLYLYLRPYRHMKQALGEQDWPRAGQQLKQIRQIVLSNLLLGLSSAVSAVSGPFF